MALLIGAFRGLVLLFELLLLAPPLYLLLLSIGALLQLRRQTVIPSRAWAEFYDALPTFAILVADRGSDWDVRTTLESIMRLDYPAGRYRAVVVTEACGDALGEIACEAGAWVYDHSGRRDRAGTDALDGALNELIVADEHFDAYAVVGSGSRLSVAFLRHMAVALAGDAQVAQARVCPVGGGDAWQVAVEAVATSLFTYLQPLGRAYFGWSAGSQGDGVCFTNDVAQRYGWGGGAQEEVERGFQLAQAGIAITYVDGAMVFTDRPAVTGPSSRAWLRALRGRLRMLASRYGWSPARNRRDRMLLRLDAALELVLPPLHILAGLIALGVVISWTLTWTPGLVIGLLAELALVAHLVVSATLADLTWQEYRSLAQAPLALARRWLGRFVQSQAASYTMPKRAPHLVRFPRSVPPSYPPGTAHATGLDARQPDARDGERTRSALRAETGAWQAMGGSTVTEASARSRGRGA